MTEPKSVARMYSGFRGVDFRGEEVNLVRSPDSVNVWKDYREIESIRTRPGLVLKASFEEKIYGIFFFDSVNGNECIVHSGKKLYSVVGAEKKVIFSDANEQKGNAFVYNSIWYFVDGKNYLQYNGVEIVTVEGYVPTTSIGRGPEGAGEDSEDINLLTGRRINTFVADSKSVEFALDTQYIDEDFKPIVRVNGEAVSGYTVDYKSGKIVFNEPVEAPLTDGQDNISVEFKKDVEGYRDRILGCTLVQVFDNRVFFSGNDSFPNTMWHCSLNDPTYFSDQDYYGEGLDAAKITGIVAGNNALWIFREPSQANTTIFYHVPSSDYEYGKIYPSTHSNVSIGCIGGAINFNDDIVFFSERGMEGIGGNITTEQVVAHRSTLVDRKLVAEAKYKDMVLVEWEGYLMVFISNKVYLADSRAVFRNEGHVEYEWFYWELEKEINCANVKDGVLYLGSDDGVYTVTGLDLPVQSYWVTAKDKFDYPQMLKTTNKKGCVVEALGDVSVYVRTENEPFEFISSHEGIADYFVCKFKKKKFKDIQLKFVSDTRFSLESATLESVIGGYIKR